MRLMRQTGDITQGVIWKQLLGFFIPLWFGTFFQQLYNTVDTVVVGRFVGKTALAAVGSTGVIVNLTVGIFTGLASGAGVVIAQFYGAKKPAKVRQAVQMSILITLVLTILFTVVGVAMTPMMLRLMTTTKDVLAAVLAKRYRVWATKGNFNNLIGMPLTVLSAPADTEVLVLEMGMNHFHEIERLSQSANPNLAIVSKIGTSHIGILGSRENIARAKAEIVQGMCAAGDFLPLLVLGGEDDFTPFIRDTFAQPAGIDVMLAGVSDDDEVRARDIRVDDEGRPVFTLDFGQGETIDTMLAIPGVQSVPNAVKAAAVAYRLGVTPEQIDAAFRGLTITGHRQEIKRAKSGARVIDDSYNASAESMAAGLDLLCSLSCTGSRMAILGEMGEMGDEAPRMHELVGAYAAAKKLDMLACVGGELAQLMADAARMMGMDEDRIQVFSDYQQVLDRMGGALEKHDVVLVKGSRFVELDRFVEGVC